MEKKKFSIKGMHCAACELWIEFETSKIVGVSKVKASNDSGSVEVEFDPKVISTKDLSETIHKIISAKGYELEFEENEGKVYVTKTFGSTFDKVLDYTLAFLIAIVLSVLYKVYIASGSVSTSTELPILTILAIGLVASFSQCGITIGSLIVGWAANFKKNHPNEIAKLNLLIGTFHISRIVSFFILGAALGYLGEKFIISGTVSSIIEVISLLVIFILALSLLDISYILDRIIPKVPKKFSLKIFSLEGSKSVLAPIMIGALSFFIPCGFTSAMQLYSLKSGSALTGAITMGVFAIGTFPVILLIGYFSEKFSESRYKYFFFKVVAFVMVFFAISGLYGVFRTYF